MDSKTFFHNFETIANAPSGIARLREIILDLAISGQLLPQLLKESDSHQLTNELLDKREASLSDKSLAIRSAVDPEIGKASFEIPSTWAWVTLSLFCHPQAGFAFKSSQFNSDGRGMPLIRIRDIGSEVTQCHYEGEFRTDFVVHRGDWLIGMDGNFNVRQWSGSDALLNQRITRLIFLDERIEQRFIAWALQKHVTALMGTKSYTTVDHLSTKQINESLIPLPPLDEQRRIVTKVDELMALCDELEAAQQRRNSIHTAARKSAIDAISIATTPDELDLAWKRISNNWTTIADTPESISSLRSLILDLAVRGSLDSSGVSAHQVPINVDLEKLKLDKDKLWKLSTALPEPAQGWSRVPMARLGQWGSGGTPTASRKEYYSNGTIPWAVIGDLNSSVMLTTESLITQKALEASSTKMIPIGAVLVAMYGASIGKSAISGIECCTNQAIAHCVVDEDVITSEYMFLVIKSLKDHLIEMGKGAAQPNISQSVLKHLVIDIPPLSAQNRVIERTDELLDLCNQLELSLIKRNDLSKKIAGSLANEVAA